jgi:hypothetical protein
MNNNGDYLWDRTGEPDPEIQQLEEVLGTLRYQPRPLEIPAGSKVRRNGDFFRHFGSRLAIAATIAIVLLGLGLWFGLQRLQRAQPQTVAKYQNTPGPGVNPASTSVPPNEKQNQVVKLPDSDQRPGDKSRRHRVDSAQLAARNETRKEAVRNPQLAVNELQEGKAAKDQLMLALRVASAKLSFAQRKTQNTNPRDPVQNQPKIGCMEHYEITFPDVI